MWQRARHLNENADGGDAYEPTFIEALNPALNDIAKYRIKVAVNAGASDTKLLHKVVTDMVKSKNLDLKVAYISGDEVFPAVQKALREGKSKFQNICTGEMLSDWTFEPVCVALSPNIHGSHADYIRSTPRHIWEGWE